MLVKRNFVFALIFLSLCNICYALPAKVLQVKADSAILMDYKTGEVLFEKRMHKIRPPASTTKIMTSILAIESNMLDDEVTISSRAAATPGSSMHLFSGQVISLRELLVGLLLRSGNDAAVAIAEYIGGSTKRFADMMNEKATKIGATNTNFVNPHGLSAPDHYSTAYDLAIIARYALANPIFSRIVSTKEASVDWLDRQGHERSQDLRNTNKLLWLLEEADGVKTGTTSQAGKCLVASATKGHQKLIAVLLHDTARWSDSRSLLQYGFQNFNLYLYHDTDDIIATVTVDNGVTEIANAKCQVPAAVVVPLSDAGSVTVQVNIPTKIKAPVFKGQKIGEIVFRVHHKTVKIVDVVSDNTIAEFSIVRFALLQLCTAFRAMSRLGIF